jgi:hypothetical protein
MSPINERETRVNLSLLDFRNMENEAKRGEELAQDIEQALRDIYGSDLETLMRTHREFLRERARTRHPQK